MTTTTAGVSAPAWLREAPEWVGLRWPSGDVSGLNAAAWNGTGANLLASADYEATVCRPNTVLETYRFGVEVGRPTGTPGGAVQPGRISIYGLVP